MRNIRAGFFSCIAGLTALAGPSAAKVLKFEIVRIESPAFEGRTFGSVGTYDRIVARATIARIVPIRSNLDAQGSFVDTLSGIF